MNDMTEPVAVEIPKATRVWATKGAEFWALFAAILQKTKPESLLELGGGRSTTFLADYAFRQEKVLVTFEQSEEWWHKLRADLRFMGLPEKTVFHLPLDERSRPFWYDIRQAKKLLTRATWDFVLIDGPQRNARRNRTGQRLIAEAVRQARLVIVDDVHRDYNHDQFLALAGQMKNAQRFYYRYNRDQNVIALAAADWAPLVQQCFTFLDIPYLTDFQPEPLPVKGDASDE